MLTDLADMCPLLEDGISVSGETPHCVMTYNKLDVVSLEKYCYCENYVDCPIFKGVKCKSKEC